MNIIILLIAVIFVYKLLFSNFGLTSDEEKRKQNNVANNFIKNVTNTEPNNNSKKVIVFGDIEEFNKIYKNYINRVSKQKTLQDKDEFDENKFLKSAEKVVGMVMDAFSEKRLDVLEKMLITDLFQIFKKKIENSVDIIYKSVIVAVTDKKIESKILDKKNKEITIRINTDQINYIENTQGEIINGSKDKIVKVEELWTFVKDQTKNQENDVWLLKSINNV